MHFPNALDDPQAELDRLDSRSRRVVVERESRVVWRLWGQGAPLVLLHGNFGSWSHWVRNIEHFADCGYQVLTPDIPGFGESPLPPDGIDADGFGSLMANSYRALGMPGRPIVVGFSLGSTIAGAMAENLGTDTAQLIVVSAGQIGARRQEIPRFASWRKAESEQARREAHANNLGIMMLADPSSIDPLAIHIQATNAPHARLDTRPITASHPLRDILFRLRCPISGIWGDRDATIGPYMDDRHDLMKDLERPSRIRIIPGAGHWVSYERPDKFNAALDELLTRES